MLPSSVMVALEEVRKKVRLFKNRTQLGRGLSKTTYVGEGALDRLLQEGLGSCRHHMISDAVEEALCFGWIDGQVRSLNEISYANRYAPLTCPERLEPREHREGAEALEERANVRGRRQGVYRPHDASASLVLLWGDRKALDEPSRERIPSKRICMEVLSRASPILSADRLLLGHERATPGHPPSPARNRDRTIEQRTPDQIARPRSFH